MIIHIGEHKIVSDKKCIGIFNFDSLMKSPDNMWILKVLDDDIKTIVVMENSDIVYSKVSPYTVIKRTLLKHAYFWRRSE